MAQTAITAPSTYTLMDTHEFNDYLKARGASASKVLNETDPHIMIDSYLYKNECSEEIIISGGNDQVNELGMSGVDNEAAIIGNVVPVVMIGSMVLNPTDIIELRIYTVDFLPEVYIKINDSKRNHEFYNNLDMSDGIKVRLHDGVGVYKKIALTFEIAPSEEPIKYNGSYVEINGRLKVPSLFNINNYSSDINHYGVLGMASMQSVNIDTNLDELESDDMDFEAMNEDPNYDNTLTTYETLKALTDVFGLGLAVTPGVREIADVKHRVFPGGISGYDLINDVLDIAGDSESILDGWVDIYYNLTVTNLQKVYNREFADVMSLKSHAITGVHSVDVASSTKRGIANLPRILTNNPSVGIGNNIYASMTDKYVDMSQLYDYGKDIQIWQANNSIGNNTLMGQHDCIVEDIKAEAYGKSFGKSQTYVFEAQEGGNTHIQEILKNIKLAKINSSVRTFYLPNLNLGIMRGMLLNVMWYHTTPAGASSELSNMMQSDPARQLTVDVSTGAVGGGESDKELSERQAIAFEQDTWVTNTEVSGVYYVTGIEYVYNYAVGKTEQWIYASKVSYNSIPSWNIVGDNV